MNKLKLNYLIFSGIILSCSCNSANKVESKFTQNSEKDLFNNIDSLESILSNLSSDTVNLENLSSEGSEKIRYFENDQIEHMRLISYGETGFSNTTYYNLNDRNYVKVINKTYNYDKPIYMEESKIVDSSFIYFLMKPHSYSVIEILNYSNGEKVKGQLDPKNIQDLCDIFIDLNDSVSK